LKEYTFLSEGVQGFLSDANFIFTRSCFHTKPVALEDNQLVVRHTFPSPDWKLIEKSLKAPKGRTKTASHKSL
jgi:hypothetical protein